MDADIATMRDGGRSDFHMEGAFFTWFAGSPVERIPGESDAVQMGWSR
ncbi:hypothetical protein [Paracoccus aminovorans]|nr:hypothetical protein [Paracoccus aminovorans]MDQ7774772.1 hypothetical protein [Paracoccus aminovorans]